MNGRHFFVFNSFCSACGRILFAFFLSFFLLFFLSCFCRSLSVLFLFRTIDALFGRYSCPKRQIAMDMSVYRRSRKMCCPKHACQQRKFCYRFISCMFSSTFTLARAACLQTTAGGEECVTVGLLTRLYSHLVRVSVCGRPTNNSQDAGKGLGDCLNTRNVCAHTPQDKGDSGSVHACVHT